MGILLHPQQPGRPLLVAFAISFVFHALLFTAIDLGSRYGFWHFTPFGILVKALGIDPAKMLTARSLPQPPAAIQLATTSKPEHEEMPTVFVDVDPSQATEEAPQNTPYYSPFNSLAANPDTSRDLGKPKLDGTQDKVLKTKDTIRPVTPAQPLQPSQSSSGESQVSQTAPERLEQIPRTTPVQRAEASRPVGETLMASATPIAPKVESSNLGPAEVGTTNASRPRYRRVADALAARQLNPYSALIGEKYKQDGGVKRYSISSSMDVRASPFGSYDARFIAAVQQCWYALLEEHRYSLDRMGKVVLEFRLTADGRITEMRVVESDVGEIFTTICELAVTKPAPYEKWPPDLRKIVGTDYRDVRFTFYY
ncbi:MAG: energy transducer TonB [Verrucomicrobiae bacterium]|nr:energy transducer TonB [Verrucomicrobiae bacterium]